MHLTNIFLLLVLWVAVIERLKAVFTVQDATIFCDHSGIWNQMMIDKLTTDIKRTETSISCLIVELLQY